MRRALFLAAFSLAGCGAPQPDMSEVEFEVGLRKIAEFPLTNWYPNCVLGSNCWHDYERFEGERGFFFQAVYENGDYGAKTGGKLVFACKNGRDVIQQIPGKIEPGWKSEWIANPCQGPVRKITMRAGMDGTWGSGTLSYFSKLF